MTFCESSLCDVPVIATNHSGHTMFLNKENSYLLDVDAITPMQPGRMHVHYWDDQLFPQLTSPKVIDEAKALMREVFENNKIAKEKNKKLKSFITDNYDINIVSKIVKERLDVIWRKIS